MIQPRDFSDRKTFPGEHGNPFDVALHQLERIQSLPDILIFLILVSLSILSGKFELPASGVMLVFFLLDWILLVGLRRTKRSFGPEKPTLLILALLRSPFMLCFPFSINLVIQGIGTLLVVYAFWIEPFRITITRLQLRTPKLAPRPLKLIHLGDLHMERCTCREEKLLEIIQQEQPDLILFSGDILNLSYLHDEKAISDARSFLSRLSAPLGVFLVSGSPAVDLPLSLPMILEGLPVHWLQNEMVLLPHGENNLQLIGLSCSHHPHQDAEKLHNLMEIAPTENFTLLLYHSPDLAPHAAQMGVDLQLSGHTHGGQFRLPWIGALFTGSLYGRDFQSGNYRLDNMMLYITRGIGMEGAAAPRMRFLCPPEVIIWEMSD